MTHDLLNNGAASGRTNRAGKVGAHIPSGIVDIALPRHQAHIDTFVLVESKGINPRLLGGLIEPSLKDAVGFGDIKGETVMGAAGWGACLPGLTEGLAGGQKGLLVNRGDV